MALLFLKKKRLNANSGTKCKITNIHTGPHFSNRHRYLPIIEHKSIFSNVWQLLAPVKKIQFKKIVDPSKSNIKKKIWEIQKWHVWKHFVPKNHTRKIGRIHKDFEPYQVFMQIYCVKILGYSFWCNGINKLCFAGIKTVYAQKIMKEKLTKFRNTLNYIKSSYAEKYFNTFKSYTADAH